MVSDPGPTPGSGRGTPLVWLSTDPALYASLEEALSRDGYAAGQRDLRRAGRVRLRGEETMLVLEVADPGRALALTRKLSIEGGRTPPTLVVLRRGELGLLGAVLRQGTLDVVVGPDPDPGEILSRLDLLRRSRTELQELGLLRREMTRRLRQLRMIHQVGKALAYSLDPEEICRSTVESLCGVFHYPRTAVFIKDGPDGDMVLRAQAGHESTQVGARIPAGRGLVGAAVTEDRIVNVTDVRKDPRHEPAGVCGTLSELVVPIHTGGVVQGVIDIQSDHEAAFDAADREAVETLAEQIGAGLSNARLYAEVLGRSEEIEEAYRKLRESDRLKDGFLSSISHELRTPLTSIRSFSEILLKSEDEDPATVAEFVEIIHEESLRLMRLVDNLLDISKMNAGMMTWAVVEADPSAVLRRAVQSALSLAQERRIEIRLDVEDDLPSIHMDVDRVIQVLLNLLSNAIKFSGPGTVIDVVARSREDSLAVDVRDQGPGIPPADLPHIFDKFRQGGDALRDKPAGSGLGLAICREIVECHGGVLSVESREGEGSTFTFALPLRAPDPVDPAARPVETAEPDRRAPLVLVVSSAVETGRALAEAFREEGLRTVRATGGEEAVRLASADRPAAIVLDILAPVESTRRLGAVLEGAPETRDVPLLLAALSEDPDASRSGADALLARPVDPAELVLTIGKLLGRRPPRVLLLEEDPRPRSFLAGLLEKAGMEPFSAGREEEFLYLARTERPDVLVIGSGRHEELLRGLRSSTALADLPVLCLAPPGLKGGELLSGASPRALARDVATRLGRPGAVDAGSIAREGRSL